MASRLTGIPAETLRMWERRYGFPAPQRDDTGVRLYSDDDVERLRLVARALKAGFRVGEVIGCERDDLETTLGAARHMRPEPSADLPDASAILASLGRDDIADVRRLLRRAALGFGPKRFVTDFAGPTCTAVGDAWARGALAVRHEHAFAECLTSQLRLLLAAYEDAERPPLVVLATLPGEIHSLGLDMVAVHLAATGASPRLLGPDLPPEQIADAARAIGADAVGISVSLASEPKGAAKHLRRLLRVLPKQCRLWIGGAGAEALEVTEEPVEHLAAWAALDAAITQSRR